MARAGLGHYCAILLLPRNSVPCTDTCRILCQIAETIDAEAGRDSSHEHLISVAPYLLHKLFCYSLLAPLQRCRFHKRAPFPINQDQCVRLHVTAFFSSPPATRETSFVHAISSAGVMYTLTRNCSMGDFESCGCDDSRNGRVGELPLCCLPRLGSSPSVLATRRAGIIPALSSVRVLGQDSLRQGGSVLTTHLSCRWPRLGLGRLQRQRGVRGEDFQALCGCFGNRT